jgi:hypothetical protein
MTPEIRRKLSELLARLPDRVARPLAVAVEFDRLEGGAMPHDVILEGLRPALKRTGLRRTGVPTPGRLFCEPFESLIVTEKAEAKRRGRIARESLQPLLTYVSETLLPEAWQAYAKVVTEATRKSDAPARRMAVVHFHADAAQALSQKLSPLKPDTPDYKAQAKEMGGARVLEDAREIVLLLEASPAFLSLREAVPLHVKRLDPGIVARVGEIYEALNNEFPVHAGYVPLIAMRRFAKPWMVMEFLKAMTHEGGDRRLVGTNLGFAVEVLLDDMELAAEHIAALEPTTLRASEALAELEFFAEAVTGFVQPIDIHRQGLWGQRLLKARGVVADAMNALLARLAREIIDALPVRNGRRGAGPGGVKPDTRHWPDTERSERAVELARFLSGAGAYSSRAAFGIAHKSTQEEVGKFLLGYGEALVEEIKRGDKETAARLEAHLVTVLRLTELALGASDAELLRRRAMAASRAA